MRVAVQGDLSRFEGLLSSQGHQIVSLEQADLDKIDAVVLSGVDDNMLGDQRRLTEAPVINAEGLTAADVLQQLKVLDQTRGATKR